MRLVISAYREDIDDSLRFARQLGCDGVISGPTAEDVAAGTYRYDALVGLRSQVESYDLTLEGFGTPPWILCYKWMLGLPGRDEQIEMLQQTIRNMGAAGVPLLVFNMHALRFYRTSWATPERGGAESSSFEMARVADAPLMAAGRGIPAELIPPEHRRPISDDEMWDNYAYFIRAVVPVAEEAGVKLALHPDDPPVPSIGGVARIMRDPEAFRRALEIEPSEALGLKFCVGCWSEMGADVAAEIRYFAERDKIFLVDFRNVVGTAGDFRETFLDNGQEDMLALMQAFVDAGYDGPIGPDHAVHLTGDDPRHRQYWAYAIGHMKALIQAAEAMSGR
jgi:mannonate dehydratase